MEFFTTEEISLLSGCTLCPRECGSNRFTGSLGYCKCNAGFGISSICVHKGEEPVISGNKGICNVFFEHCNLQCIYCQNHEISRNDHRTILPEQNFNNIIYRICNTLEETENMVGFVSPSHYVPQMMAIIRGLHHAGKHPVIVYNTNAYDKVDTLKRLEGMVDIYLPDFKYMDATMAQQYSQAKNYPAIASSALKEMYRQKGSALIVNNGIAESGIIVRHLVLPGAVMQSIDIMRFIAEEISTKLHISLMAQYYPTALVKNHLKLNRTISNNEYQQVIDAFHNLGFYHGWIQDLESHLDMRPNFSKDKPFE